MSVTRTPFRSRPRSIGVVGGLGPGAGVNMCARILSIAQEIFGAEHDDDYPDLVLISRPLEGFGREGRDTEQRAEGLFVL